MLDGLDPASLAAVVSAFTLRGRARSATAPFPSRTRRSHRRLEAIEELAEASAPRSVGAGLPVDAQGSTPASPRSPSNGRRGATSPGPPAAAGTAGEASRRRRSMSGGDFVRNMKQLVDLLRQIGRGRELDERRICPGPPPRRRCPRAT